MPPSVRSDSIWPAAIKAAVVCTSDSLLERSAVVSARVSPASATPSMSMATSTSISEKAADVAQIFNLLYRRFVIGGPSEINNGVRLEKSAAGRCGKAAEGSRTPRRFADFVSREYLRQVLECGCPLP